MNDGYEWVVDIDIEQFFDKVNHDKLIHILREQVNDSTTLRVIVMKQWKKPKTIYRNLSYLNWKNHNGFSREEIYKVANSRLGWYRRSGMNVVNFIISKDLLENRIKDGAGLLNPLSYYLVKAGI